MIDTSRTSRTGCSVSISRGRAWKWWGIAPSAPWMTIRRLTPHKRLLAWSRANGTRPVTGPRARLMTVQVLFSVAESFRSVCFCSRPRATYLKRRARNGSYHQSAAPDHRDQLAEARQPI